MAIAARSEEGLARSADELSAQGLRPLPIAETGPPRSTSRPMSQSIPPANEGGSVPREV